MRDSNGRLIEISPHRTPVELLVPLSRQRLQPWEWGDLATFRTRVSGDLSKSIPMAIGRCEQNLETATPQEFEALLAPVLNLVAPNGMSANERAMWIKSAVMMLAGVPKDLLQAGCRHAMGVCDHPSKAVPAILASAKQVWNARKIELAGFQRLACMATLEASETKSDQGQCTPETAREIRKEFGIYDKNDDDPKPRKHKGRAKLPSRADYIDLGMTPEQCDAAGIA